MGVRTRAGISKRWVEGRLRELRPKRDVFDLPRNLHLGAGGVKVPGWTNVDLDPRTVPDVVDNILDLKAFPFGHAERIYACHVLEHVAQHQVPVVLRRWFEVIQPGGEIRISVPDLDRIVRIYSANWEHFQKDENEPWVGLIYGAQTDQYDFHKAGFNFVSLRRKLHDVGFVDVAEYPHSPHFLGIQDASMANEPFGEYVSLNVVARRPM